MAAASTDLPDSIDAVSARLAERQYVCARRLATAVFLSLKLGRPLFLEGEPGVGKTELAKVLADALGTTLLRLQCYEGLEVSQAAYEWNVARQMMEIRLAEAVHDTDRAALMRHLYTREMLIERPLLASLTRPTSPVLLIDELDRADEPFDAFLLEMLAEGQLTIPEFGTVRAAAPPWVVITSNRTREVHDALKRRCLYHWIDFPSAEDERRIVRLKARGADERLSAQVVSFVQSLRTIDLFKPPGVSESIDWARALAALNATHLNADVVADTLGVLLKHREDIERVAGGEGAKILESLG